MSTDNDVFTRTEGQATPKAHQVRAAVRGTTTCRRAIGRLRSRQISPPANLRQTPPVYQVSPPPQNFRAARRDGAWLRNFWPAAKYDRPPPAVRREMVAAGGCVALGPNAFDTRMESWSP
jgi:hypothetical protein